MDSADEALKPSTLTVSHRRAIPPGSLQKTLEAHQAWVRSRGKEGARAELSEADLGRANLRTAVLMEANLQRADLDRAILEGARLQRADLQHASLRGADLQRASMQRVNLQGADLFEANLEEAELAEANLQAVNLLAANLREADLQRANLQRAFMKQALLHDASLPGANVSGANLQEADLAGADLQRALLCEANLAGANLRGADLQGAELHGCNLQAADLQQTYLRDANLRGTTGLVASQLAGTDLAGAKLPGPLRHFTGVATACGLTQQGRRLLAIVVLVCVASWLCVASTTDTMLLTNAPAALFPRLPLPISSGWLYTIMPILLVSLYVYFHLHLQRLWEELAALPAVFPDGRPVDRIVYPWLVHGMIRLHSERLRGYRYPLLRLQTSISVVLTRWLVPITLLLFWVRYLPRHSWQPTLLHIATFVIAIAFMVTFQVLARHTLRLRPTRRYRYGALAVVTAFGVNVVMSMIWLAVLTGVPAEIYAPDAPQGATAPKLPKADIRRLVPVVLTLIKASPFADLTAAEVSQKPAPWTAAAERIEQIKGAPLREANLRYAKARGAFLVNADLRGAILIGADLRQADLRGAQLEGADLQGAVLYGADLRHTKGLTKAQISMAFIDATTRLPQTLAGKSPATPDRPQPDARQMR